jgi:xanthine dehydrogenase YagS FAD-binding subunit
MFHCRKKGGQTCFAQTGENELHAIYANRTCAATHPSTIVTALVALGAKLEIAGKQPRAIELEALFVRPETDVKREVALSPGEIITAITIAPSKRRMKSAYTKQVAKQSFDWPIVDCAVVLQMAGTRCESAVIVLGAVAPTPLRASAAEKLLAGKAIDDNSAREAAQAMAASATPLSGNAYKIPIVEAVLTRTILAATRAS